MNEARAKSKGALGLGPTATICASFREPHLEKRPVPSRQATRLLSQILGRLIGLETPVIQIVQCTPSLVSPTVTRDLAMACLYWLGRTLVVNVSPVGGNCSLVSSDAGMNLAGEIDNELARKPGANVVRDAVWPDLFTAELGVRTGDLHDGQYPIDWLGKLRSEFRMMLLDCGNLSLNPVAVELTSRCHGSLLTVAAGSTTQNEVQTAERQVKSCGGLVLGAIIYKSHRLCLQTKRRQKSSVTVTNDDHVDE